MGLSAGPVPSRVDACVKAGLLDLVDHAVDAGWSSRRAAAGLGVDDSRLARWQQRRECGELTDRAPGGAPLHGLLAAERAAILTLFQTWGEIDRSHRKLAHRGSRLDLVHVSESTVLRVLAAEGIALPGNPRRDPIPRTPWPDWLEWKPNHIWAYDFTHFTRARRAAIAILDMVSRKWLTTLVAAEESSTQVEVAFTAALDAEGMSEAAESWASPELQAALADRDHDALAELTTAGQVPLLLAVSDNGPQMRSYSTREFMAALREAWDVPNGLPAPAALLKIGMFFLRTEPELVLKSRYVVPGRLLDAGFQFEFPTWPEAAADLVRQWRRGREQGSE